MTIKGISAEIIVSKNIRFPSRITIHTLFLTTFQTSIYNFNIQLHLIAHAKGILYRQSVKRNQYMPNDLDSLWQWYLFLGTHHENIPI